MKLKFPTLTIPQSKESEYDQIFIWSIRFSIFFNIVSLIIIIIHWQKLPPSIPLFFSLPWGEEQLSTPIVFATLSLSGVLFLLINNTFGFLISKHSPLFARMLFFMSILTTLLMLITTIQIILMIT